jgi:CheY-like chemotaxis protein
VPAQARASLLEALVKNGMGLEQLSPPEKIQSILVVEGSAFFANRIKATLEKEGFAVRTSNDPQHALQLTREFAPDLVLSEIQIKESGDGLDMLNAGLSQVARPFHIIISTNSRDPELMGRIKALQPKAVLFKPYRCEELLQHLS